MYLSSIQIINQVHSFHKSCAEKANSKRQEQIQIQRNTKSIFTLISCISKCICLVFKLSIKYIPSTRGAQRKRTQSDRNKYKQIL